MKRIQLSRSFRLDDLFIFLALFCVSTFSLLEHASIYIPVVSTIKWPLLWMGLACLVTQIKVISRGLCRSNYLRVMLYLVVLSILLACTVLVNRNTVVGGSPLMRTVRLLVYIFELFALVIVMAEKGYAKKTIGFLFWYVVVIAAINDALMFSRIITFGTKKHEGFMIGSKFTVAYLHMNLLTLWMVRRKWHTTKRQVSKKSLILGAAALIGVVIRVDCMTGIIGCVALIVLFALVDTPRRSKLLKFTSPTALGLMLAASVIFALLIDVVVQLPFVKYLVEEVLGRTKTLTGRTLIYGNFIENMSGKWLSGYGYGNGNAAAVTLFGYANAQNGVLQWVLQVGVPATMLLLGLMLEIFRQIHRKRLGNMEKILPLVALIYMYVILGTVETTFNMNLLMWFALIMMLANEKNKSQLPAGRIVEIQP